MLYAVVCFLDCTAVRVGFVAGEVSSDIAPRCTNSDESLARLPYAVYLPKYLSYVDTCHVAGAT